MRYPAPLCLLALAPTLTACQGVPVTVDDPVGCITSVFGAIGDCFGDGAVLLVGDGGSTYIVQPPPPGDMAPPPPVELRMPLAEVVGHLEALQGPAPVVVEPAPAPADAWPVITWDTP